MKYFTFGMKVMRITQSYNGTASHKPHWYNSKDYSDYPIDIAGQDGGQDIYYATCDMEIKAIKGVGSSVTNTVWLVCLENKNTPLGNNIKPFIALTHWNDNDPYMKNRKVGDIVRAGEPICREGTDGASANHLHLVCGDANRGCGDGFIQNSNGKWVSNGYCYRPEQIMYINSNFTKIENTSDIKFEVKAIGYNKGDSNSDIEKINNFLADKVRGNYYGDYSEACISVYKKKNGLEEDGSFIDNETLDKMKQEGLQL